MQPNKPLGLIDVFGFCPFISPSTYQWLCSAAADLLNGLLILENILWANGTEGSIWPQD
jgi:hypothetical protein